MPAYTGGSGYRFNLMFAYEDGTPINLNAAQNAWAVMRLPNGTEEQYVRGDGLVVDDGAAGLAHIVRDDMADPGPYVVQGWVIDSQGRGPIPSAPATERAVRSPTTAPSS